MADDIPFGAVADAITGGAFVAFLGAGASAVYRSGNWSEGSEFLPFGGELSQYLAEAGAFPDPDRSNDLPLVASYFEHVAADRRLLGQRLRRVFDVDCPPGSVHRLLARLPITPIIITTNYDDLMEQALRAEGKPFHLVVDRGDKNRVWVAQSANGGEAFEPVRTNDLRKALQPDAQPIVYKMHGCIHRDRPEDDTVLITEQDYVDFLGRGQKKMVPAYLDQRMADASFLFLGYSLVDWNVRVLLHKLRSGEKTDRSRPRSWAVVWQPGKPDQKIWERHGINMYSVDLKAFVEKLAAELGIAVD